MTPAFWDASGLVPLCVQEKGSATVRQLLDRHSVVVWWATPVELRSAFERLLRVGELTTAEYAIAEVRLDHLRSGWREMEPNQDLRAEAEHLLGRYVLKGADALQLAAASVWAGGSVQGTTLISGDAQLLAAARSMGFRVETV